MHLIQSTSPVHPVVDEGGGKIFELLGANGALGGAKNHSIIRLELAPGASSPCNPHFHQRSEETYVVLSGNAELRVDDLLYVLSAGDIAAVGVGEVHQITATGDKPLTALAIMAPGFDLADVYEVGSD